MIYLDACEQFESKNLVLLIFVPVTTNVSDWEGLNKR